MHYTQKQLWAKCAHAVGVLVAFVTASPAAAQHWKEYTFPRYAVVISFLAKPTAETVRYRTAGGHLFKAQIYSARWGGGTFKLMIADISDATLNEGEVIGDAVKTLSLGGEVEFHMPYHVQQLYGCQINISGADGSYSSVGLFYHKGRLYQIEGKSISGGKDGSADVIRFQHSFNFTSPRLRGPPQSGLPAYLAHCR
jgi:hypothetical protein